MNVLLATALITSLTGFAPDNRTQTQFREKELRLLFWDHEDITSPFGKIEFGAEPLKNRGTAFGYPGMQYGCEAPRTEGGSFVYGWRIQNWSDATNRVLEVVRCTTEDGKTFFDEQVVFSYGKTSWQGFANVVRQPDNGEIYLFSWAEGHLYVFKSKDGHKFELLTKEAYIGHDAMCVTWHPDLNRFLNYQTITQPYQKRYPDNIGFHRRVLSFQKSSDGVTWEMFSPRFLGGQMLWQPDAADPADLEFYRCIVFPHLGRYAMLLVNYVPPPPNANSRRGNTKHGPSYMAEWAISRDGLNWERPFRNINAYACQFWMPTQGPIAGGGLLRFYHPDGRIAALVSDRIFYTTCRANGEFSTKTFQMPTQGLFLNAYLVYPEVERPNGQSYVMAELTNVKGEVIEGYEREKCLFEDCDGQNLPLLWEGKNGNELAGQNVRVRFFLRAAKIYELTGAWTN